MSGQLLATERPDDEYASGFEQAYAVRRPRRKTEIGVVTSDRMNKTRKVEITILTPHKKYGKLVKRRTVCHAHDEANLTKAGDWVEIMETRPLSKLKRWRVVRIVQVGVQAALAEEGEEATSAFRDRLVRLRTRSGSEARGRVTDHPSSDSAADYPDAKERVMSPSDNAKAWKEQFNDRRLLLLRKKYETGLDTKESDELERLQQEASLYLRRRLPTEDTRGNTSPVQHP